MHSYYALKTLQEYKNFNYNIVFIIKLMTSKASRKEKLGRRRFLKYAGAIIVVAAAASAIQSNIFLQNI